VIKTLTNELTIGKTTERIIMVSIFSILTFAAAMIRIYTPLSPVPFTLQTFVLFISVYYLSSKESGIAQSAYILAGMIGAPVFAAGITGTIALVGPTAGYLMGFVIAGMLMSYAVSKTKKMTYVKAMAIFSAGSIIILALGTLHLVLFYKMNISAAIMAGFVMFIPYEILKAAAAASFFGIKK
jgi:biotin transport system substrate-specific component